MTPSRRILLAEDDPRDLDLTLRALEAKGLADLIDVVHDGEQALDYLFRRGQYADRPAQLPAVAVLDMKMPKVEGVEVLRQVRADPKLCRLPVVMFTSSRQEADVSLSYELGTNAYVVKPVDFSEFRSAIDKLGAFWATVNEPPPG